MNVKNLGLVKALNTRYDAYFHMGYMKQNDFINHSYTIIILLIIKILYNHIYQNLHDEYLLSKRRDYNEYTK